MVVLYKYAIYGGYSGIMHVFLHKNSGDLEHTYYEINFSFRTYIIRTTK